jgi:hypothetical protein
MRKRCKLGQTDQAIIPYGYFTSSKCFLFGLQTELIVTIETLREGEFDQLHPLHMKSTRSGQQGKQSSQLTFCQEEQNTIAETGFKYTRN